MNATQYTPIQLRTRIAVRRLRLAWKGSEVFPAIVACVLFGGFLLACSAFLWALMSGFLLLG